MKRRILCIILSIVFTLQLSGGLTVMAASGILSEAEVSIPGYNLEFVLKNCYDQMVVTKDGAYIFFAGKPSECSLDSVQNYDIRLGATDDLFEFEFLDNDANVFAAIYVSSRWNEFAGAEGASIKPVTDFTKGGASSGQAAPVQTTAPTAAKTETETVNISVTYNGSAIVFSQPPLLRNGYAFYPLEDVFEAFSGGHEWNPVTYVVSGKMNGNTVEIPLNSLCYIINGAVLDVPDGLVPFVENERTYVYLDYIVEGLGLSVSWDANTRTISIYGVDSGSRDLPVTIRSNGDNYIIDSYAVTKDSDGYTNVIITSPYYYASAYMQSGVNAPIECSFYGQDGVWYDSDYSTIYWLSESDITLTVYEFDTRQTPKELMLYAEDNYNEMYVFDEASIPPPQSLPVTVACNGGSYIIDSYEIGEDEYGFTTITISSPHFYDFILERGDNIMPVECVFIDEYGDVYDWYFATLSWNDDNSVTVAEYEFYTYAKPETLVFYSNGGSKTAVFDIVNSYDTPSPANVPTAAPTPVQTPTPTTAPTPAPTFAPIATPKPTPQPISGTIHQLADNKTITVSITGSSIQSTSVKLTNETSGAVSVVIDYGTWFKSNSSSVQSMLVTSKKTVELTPDETRTVSVSTACMNISRDIPSSSNSFTLNSYSSSEKLAKLVKYADENNCSYAVIQSAVWIITDNVTDNELRGSLVDSSGNSVIQQSHIDEARKIIKGL